MKSYFHILIILLTTLLASVSYSCTTVFSNDTGKTKVVARSMDLYMPDSPIIVVYPRGMSRDGNAGENSLEWKSKYGSVVVTAFRSKAVSDGMNEKGLAVHLLYLVETKYEARNEKLPALSNLLWAQYFLDNFQSVNEALLAVKKFQVIATQLKGKEWPIHLAMEDKRGDSAIIEFIDGKMKIYHGYQYQVMTNEPAYNIQLNNLRRYLPFGGTLVLPGDPDPFSRFVRVSAYLKTLPKPKTDLEAVANVLSVIRTAAVPFGAVDHSGNKTEDAWATRWISMADLNNKIYYFNSMMTPNIIWLDLENLDFSEGAPVLSINPVNKNLVGEISKKLKEDS